MGMLANPHHAARGTPFYEITRLAYVQADDLIVKANAESTLKSQSQTED